MRFCRMLGKGLALCAVLVVVPCAAMAMGGTGSCENPEGRIVPARQEYEFDSCGQTRGAQVKLTCMSSDALRSINGTMTPYCSVDYESKGSGSGNWDGTKGSTKTLRRPKKISVILGTVKITNVMGFH